MLFYLMLENIKIMDWIDVNDRLPETDHNDFSKVVLAVNDRGTIKTTRLDTEYSKKGYWIGFDFSDSNVTHWAELPEPPKQ
jgi:hypothetical protein